METGSYIAASSAAAARSADMFALIGSSIYGIYDVRLTLDDGSEELLAGQAVAKAGGPRQRRLS